MPKKDQADSKISRKCNNAGTSCGEGGKDVGAGRGDGESERGLLAAELCNLNVSLG